MSSKYIANLAASTVTLTSCANTVYNHKYNSGWARIKEQCTKILRRLPSSFSMFNIESLDEITTVREGKKFYDIFFSLGL